MKITRTIQHFGPTPAPTSNETSPDAIDAPLTQPVRIGGVLMMQPVQEDDREGATLCRCVCHINLSEARITCDCHQDVRVYHE